MDTFEEETSENSSGKKKNKTKMKKKIRGETGSVPTMKHPLFNLCWEMWYLPRGTFTN